MNQTAETKVVPKPKPKSGEYVRVNPAMHVKSAPGKMSPEQLVSYIDERRAYQKMMALEMACKTKEYKRNTA